MQDGFLGMDLLGSRQLDPFFPDKLNLFKIGSLSIVVVLIVLESLIKLEILLSESSVSDRSFWYSSALGRGVSVDVGLFSTSSYSYRTAQIG